MSVREPSFSPAIPFVLLIALLLHLAGCSTNYTDPVKCGDGYGLTAEGKCVKLTTVDNSFHCASDQIERSDGTCAAAPTDWTFPCAANELLTANGRCIEQPAGTVKLSFLPIGSARPYQAGATAVPFGGVELRAVTPGSYRFASLTIPFWIMSSGAKGGGTSPADWISTCTLAETSGGTPRNVATATMTEYTMTFAMDETFMATDPNVTVTYRVDCDTTVPVYEYPTKAEISADVGGWTITDVGSGAHALVVEGEANVSADGVMATDSVVLSRPSSVPPPAPTLIITQTGTPSGFIGAPDTWSTFFQATLTPHNATNGVVMQRLQFILASDGPMTGLPNARATDWIDRCAATLGSSTYEAVPVMNEMNHPNIGDVSFTLDATPSIVPVITAPTTFTVQCYVRPDAPVGTHVFFNSLNGGHALDPATASIAELVFDQNEYEGTTISR